MNNPCINCTKRYPACQDTCPEGLLRKARQEKIKEARRQEHNIALYKFTLAIDRPVRKDKEKQTDFPRVVVFGKQAENCERYLEKGRLVGIQGRLQTGSYKNKDGQTVYTTDVVADRVEFLSWGDKEQSDKPEDHGLPSGFKALDDEDMPF